MRELSSSAEFPSAKRAHPALQLDSAALLSLLRWVSPTLPVGAYAYSRGLEQAVTAGWVHDEASALAWILGVLRHGVGQLDVPVLARLHEAYTQGSPSRVEHWNDYLGATRESRELALEDEQMGQAFLRVLKTTFPGEQWMSDRAPSYVTMFARAATLSHVPILATLLGFLWATGESQVSAAVRLIPLGQSAAQRMLAALSVELPAIAAQAAALGDEELGSALPALALASARHETQYTRLFRS